MPSGLTEEVACLLVGVMHRGKIMSVSVGNGRQINGIGYH